MQYILIISKIFQDKRLRISKTGPSVQNISYIVDFNFNI